MSDTQKTIIDILLEKNRLTETEAARFDKNLPNLEIEKVLRQENLVSSEDIGKAYSEIYQLPFIKLESYDISPEAFYLIPRDLIAKYKILIFDKNQNNEVKVALADLANLKSHPPAILEELKNKKNLNAELYVTTPEDIQAILTRFAHLGDTVEVKDLEGVKDFSKMPNVKTVDLTNIRIPYETISKFPVEISTKYKMVVFDNPAPAIIRVAVSNPLDPKVQEILDFVREKNEIAIEEFVASPSDIDQSIKMYYQKNAKINRPEAEKPWQERLEPEVPTEEIIFEPEEKATIFDINKTTEPVTKPVEPPIIPTPAPVASNPVQNAVPQPAPVQPPEPAPTPVEPVKVAPPIEAPKQAEPAVVNQTAYVPPTVSLTPPIANMLAGGGAPAAAQPVPRPIPVAPAAPHVTVKAPEDAKHSTYTAPDYLDPVTTVHAPKAAEPKQRFRLRPVPVAQVAPAQAQPAMTLPGQAPGPGQSEESKVNAVIIAENDLDTFLGREIKFINDLKQIAQTGNVPYILAAAVSLAAYMKASDIHIEPEEKDLRIRFRVDGVLRDMIRMPLILEPALMSRIKILSRLKIDETRIPQDGRFDVKAHGHEIDLRVSTLPTVRGEKAALRLLDKSQNIYTLEELGITGRGLKVIEENITKPYGVILSTGPTGSGKSTTLYSILKKIASPAVNVITLEDPVEYEIPGINQCQVKPKIGFSFAEGLRSVLRQDPNIIMVGEIRDAETAGMTTHAALTGHLVLSTLHTNDAAGALPRMINMGIEPFLITSSMNLIIGQRLVRKICPKCRHEVKIPDTLMQEITEELKKFNLQTPYKFYEGAGCDACNNGFTGRIGIYEVLEMTEKIEELAIKKRPGSEINQAAVEDGMVTMKQDGLFKALKGVTTVAEVYRVTNVKT